MYVNHLETIPPDPQSMGKLPSTRLAPGAKNRGPLVIGLETVSLFTLCLRVRKAPARKRMVSGDVNGTWSSVHLLTYPGLSNLTVCSVGLSSQDAENSKPGTPHTHSWLRSGPNGGADSS